MLHGLSSYHSFFPSRAALERMTPNQRSFYIEVASDPRVERQWYPGR